MKNGTPEGYYRIQDVCRIMGKSRSTVYRMFSVADGRLPKPYKDGKLLLWDRKEFDVHFKNGKFLK